MAAHAEVPGVTNVIDSIEPAPPEGVTIQVTRSVADQIVAENTTAADLEVLGEDGEPFLRIGPRGVEADVRSPGWHRSNSPEGSPALPAGVSAASEPQWVQISPHPSWGWFDHRLHEAPLSMPPDVGPGEELVLERWEIPMRLGETPMRVQGRRLFSRPAGNFNHHIESRIPGMQVSVLDGKIPAIFLTAPGQPGVELLGLDGEAFARFGPDGAEVNEASATWALTARSDGQFDPDGPVGPGVEPRWRLVNQEAQLIWLEPRAAPPVDGRDHLWSVPARWEGREVALRGRSEWMSATPTPPEPRRFPVGWPHAAGLAAAVAILLLGLGRGRRVKGVA